MTIKPKATKTVSESDELSNFFSDQQGKMNLNVRQVQGELLDCFTGLL